MCVQNQVFLAIQEINSTTNKDGFIGLGPPKIGNDQSYVVSLKEQGQIIDLKVGLNYESNSDQSQISTITFGYFDLTQMDEAAGMYTFPNKGEESWSLQLKRFKIGDTNIFIRSYPYKVAHLDTANLWIQLPMSEFNEVSKKLLQSDPTI